MKNNLLKKILTIVLFTLMVYIPLTDSNILLANDNSDLNQDVESMKDAITILVLENNKLKNINTKLEGNIKKLNEELSIYKEKNIKLTFENDCLKDEKNINSNNLKLNYSIKEENEKLVADNKKLKNIIASLDGENNQLKQDIENKKLENERLVKDNKTLKEKNASLDSSNNQLKHVIESKKEENKKLQDEINDTELPVALKTQIDELKRFVEDNCNDLNQVDEAKKLVSVRKILTSAKALEQLKNLITVVEVRLDKDKITISLDGFEEKLNWPDKEELAKDKFDDEVIKDLSEKFIEKMSKLFDSARRSKSHARVLLIPSLDKSKLPNVCWRFFYKMYSSKNLYDTSFIKELYMPDNYIHIKE